MINTVILNIYIYIYINYLKNKFYFILRKKKKKKKKKGFIIFKVFFFFIHIKYFHKKNMDIIIENLYCIYLIQAHYL